MIASESLRDAGGGPTPTHVRTPLPRDRMITWQPRAAPRDDAEEGQTQPAYEILVERDVLSSMNLHLGNDPSEPRFGFLLGHLHRCPESGIHYSVVEVAVLAKEPLDEEASGAYLLRAWSETRTRLGGYSGLLLGWYHAHRHLGLMLSEADLDSGRRYFGEPWQVSVIVVPDADRPLGGVFRLPTATAGPAAARPVPFYELLDTPLPSDAPAPTSVPWTNYESDRRVRMVRQDAGARTVPPARRSDPPGPAPEEPPRKKKEKSPAQKPPRAKSKAKKETEAPAKPSRAEPPPQEPAEAVDPPPEAPAEAPSPAEVPQPVEPAAAEPRPAEPVAAEPPSEETVQRRRATTPLPSDSGTDATSRPPGVTLVMPAASAEAGLLPPRGRRAAWPLIVGAVLLVVLALVFLLPGSPAGRSGAGPAVRPVPQRAAVSAEEQAFFEDVEQLDLATVRYAERAGDFDDGRIGCDFLVTGYVAADEAYFEVAATYRNLGAQANATAVAAYEDAGVDIAEVNTHFDASGCPRP